MGVDGLIRVNDRFSILRVPSLASVLADGVSIAFDSYASGGRGERGVLAGSIHGV